MSISVAFIDIESDVKTLRKRRQIEYHTAPEQNDSHWYVASRVLASGRQTLALFIRLLKIRWRQFEWICVHARCCRRRNRCRIKQIQLLSNYLVAFDLMWFYMRFSLDCDAYCFCILIRRCSRTSMIMMMAMMTMTIRCTGRSSFFHELSLQSKDISSSKNSVQEISIRYEQIKWNRNQRIYNNFMHRPSLTLFNWSPFYWLLFLSLCLCIGRLSNFICWRCSSVIFRNVPINNKSLKKNDSLNVSLFYLCSIYIETIPLNRCKKSLTFVTVRKIRNDSDRDWLWRRLFFFNLYCQ